ncbi:xanthine/uracil/vitamin C permease [Hoyosella sp. YIM 151337]|uniref:solute carrier family 23 protein n=1 Tax=Hoyosella sp. YIM 151337 TaxID=2992742 RepID=UPI00223574F3|nr:solute carrier family 23 protein [Hoyosella sp. YIM 151337]MCW4354526.1 xanthine/uracil/vitamin C permease [Hoyosella sp. YIM 151337]
MRTSYLLKRKEGQEQPYWSLGYFKIRLPLVHYPLELAEAIQALVMFVVGLAMIPLLQQYLGLSFEVALTICILFMGTFLLPTLLGVPLAAGWITPAIPLVLIYLSAYEPGPEAIKALVALHIVVTVIFLFLGISRLAGKLVRCIPASVKGGILLGAGIAAIAGEIEEGGRFMATPLSIGVGALVVTITMFSLFFRRLCAHSRFAMLIATYGLVPGLLAAIGVGWVVGEYPLPSIEWGITQPAFSELWQILPFTIGWPTLDMFIAAIPIAVISYIIAYGDLIVGAAVLERADKARPDEHIEIDADRVHVVTGIRNLLHAAFIPLPGQAGPIFTALAASVATRYEFGRKAMESVYGGVGTFYIVGFAAMFTLPLVTLFQPVLPIALSLTLLITGYLCLVVGMQQISNAEQYAVAGITGVVLAAQGAAWGIAIGLLLHVVLERTSLVRREPPSARTPAEATEQHS